MYSATKHTVQHSAAHYRHTVHSVTSTQCTALQAHSAQRYRHTVHSATSTQCTALQAQSAAHYKHTAYRATKLATPCHLPCHTLARLPCPDATQRQSPSHSVHATVSPPTPTLSSAARMRPSHPVSLHNYNIYIHIHPVSLHNCICIYIIYTPGKPPQLYIYIYNIYTW